MFSGNPQDYRRIVAVSKYGRACFVPPSEIARMVAEAEILVENWKDPDFRPSRAPVSPIVSTVTTKRSK